MNGPDGSRRSVSLRTRPGSASGSPATRCSAAATANTASPATSTCARTGSKSASATAGPAPSRSGLSSPPGSPYEIPEHVSVTAAALVEPGGNSLRAVRAANIQPGQTGARPRIGHHRPARRAVRPRRAGARSTSAGVREGSLELARSLGVQHTSQLDELLQPRIRSVRCGHRGDQQRRACPPLSVRLAKPAGRVVFIGLSSTPSLVDTRDIALKDITAVGILSASPGLAGAIEQLRQRVGRSGLDRQRGRRASMMSPDRLEGRRGPNAGPGPKVHVDPRLRHIEMTDAG